MDMTAYFLGRAAAEGSGSGGVTYTNIVYKEDNTIELTDTDGIVHTMECSYEDGKLVSVKYDEKSVVLKYDDDVLVSVGGTTIDMSNAPYKSTSYVYTIYEHFGVDKAEYPYLFFYHWENQNRGTLKVYFAKSFELDENGIIILQEHLKKEQSSIYPPFLDNVKSISCGIVAITSAPLQTATSGFIDSYDKPTVTTYTNVNIGETTRYSNIVKI